jgi:predicted TIM-barrel fold metal-dependent hydrolase
MPTRMLSFPVFDVDNHMYETRDAFTRYLPKQYEGIIRYVEIEGRTKIVVNGRLSDYIPNPTFEVVAAPGAQEDYFRAKNVDSMFKKKGETFKKTGETPRIVPEKDASGRVKPIRSIPAFFEPEPRLELMDELGIDRSMMWPTLASLLEERLSTELEATHAVIHSLNEWMYETWTFDFGGRIFATPIVTLPLLDRALQELDWVLERGARAILVRPAPVPGYNGLRRSFALPEFDPFWKRVEDADVMVGMHSSDSGYQKYTNEWEGLPPDREMLPFERNPNRFAFGALREGPSPVVDTVASIIGHQLALRFPKLKFAPVENGSSWVRPLLDRMAKAYERMPQVFPEDPVEVFKRSIFVHPFHEEDPVGLVKLIGEDNVLFGSDFPHPEGLADPISFVDQLDGLPEPAIAKVMGGNLSRLMKVEALAS